MPSWPCGPRPDTAAGVADRRVDTHCWPRARHEAGASIEALPDLPSWPRAAPLPFARRLSRHGSSPVRAETHLCGSARRSRVEPGRPRSGRAAMKPTHTHVFIHFEQFDRFPQSKRLIVVRTVANKSGIHAGPSKEVVGLPYAERPIIKLVSAIGPIAIIVTTSALYLAGSSADSLILEHYGLASSLLDKPSQKTIVDGYYGLVRGFPIFVAGLIKTRWVVAWLMNILAGLVIGWQLVKRGRTNLSGPDGWVWKLYRTLVLVGLSYVVFHIATVSAGLATESDITRIDKVVAAGCLQCRTYRTEQGDFAGVLIDGDKQRVVIVQRGGIRVLKIDQLLAVLAPGVRGEVAASTAKRPGGR